MEFEDWLPQTELTGYEIVPYRKVKKYGEVYSFGKDIGDYEAVLAITMRGNIGEGVVVKVFTMQELENALVSRDELVEHYGEYEVKEAEKWRKEYENRNTDRLVF